MFGIFKEIIKLRKDNQELTNALKNELSKDKTVIIGTVTKYTKEDIEFLRRQKDSLNIIVKYIKYKIAIKTDMLRNMHDNISPEEKAGYLNALHNMLNFFDDLIIEKKENEKTGQNLV